MNKTWCSVELNKTDADIFSKYLRDKGIYFEPSSCYNLVHFECHMNNIERETANEFIHKNILRREEL